MAQTGDDSPTSTTDDGRRDPAAAVAASQAPPPPSAGQGAGWALAEHPFRTGFWLATGALASWWLSAGCSTPTRCCC